VSDRTRELPAEEDRPARLALRYLGWMGGRLYFAAQIVWRAILHLIDDSGMTFAGHIAFMTLFSLFPFLIFLTTLAGELGQSLAAREFVQMTLEAFPKEVSQAIRPAVEQVISTRSTGLMTISIVASLWAVSSGIEALREALNRAYGVAEPRPIWFCRLQSLLFTVVFSVCVIAVMIILVIGPVVLSYVAPLLKLQWRSSLLYETGRYVLAILLIYLVVAVLYRWLPSRHLPRREVLPGAAVTVVLWILLASLFSLYLQNLTRFTVTYGSLGGIVITLVFFYVSALIFIFGAELNSARRRSEAARLREEHARRREPASG
jgi:membrane protein